MLLTLTLLAQLSVTGDSLGGTVVADTIRSHSLGIEKQYYVYLPPSYGRESARRYPVAYYLHGVTGNESNWVRLGRIDAVMDSLIAAGTPEMVLVMPDGDDSWYTTWNSLGNYARCRREPPRDEPATSYCVPWPHYDDYIARDLVAHVDSNYRTFPDSARRAIAGLSMGGYGAVTLALRYPDVFSAAASHSGVVAPLFAGPTPFAPPPHYHHDMDSVRAANARLWRYLREPFGPDTIGWRARDPVTMARRRAAAELPIPHIFLDVGTEDPWVDANRAFAHELQLLGAPVIYNEWSGGHSWEYWRAHVPESLVWIAARIAPARAVSAP
ncbi:MAG TPA: alpha/beta hydrolase-fold protein [Gemmatimonadaceae bacterium]|nr:alpha/beta hydrolase-fold protein [Gemmatimonadaceae bacterium]